MTRGPASSQACPICQETARERLFESADYLTGESFTVARCARCGTARTLFPHPEEEIGSYYGNTYYGREGRRFLGTLEWLVRLFRRGRVRAVLRLHPGPGRVLDVGSGRGLILRRLRSLGWDCYGTELSADLAQLLRESGVEVFTGPLEEWGLPESSFDVILLWHSLEHQFEPAQVLAEVRRLLKPGGRLLLEVPNFGSRQAAVGGSRWFHLDVPRHLLHFSRPTLAALLGGQGFETLRWSTWSLEQGPFGFAQSLLNRVCASPNLLYGLMKGHALAEPTRRKISGPRRALDLGLTLVLAVPAVAVAVGAEAVTALAGRGGVLNIVARKVEVR
ncbi:MAG: class I SAM-dependent methyltransferase [Acidobacteriota bacterium]